MVDAALAADEVKRALAYLDEAGGLAGAADHRAELDYWRAQTLVGSTNIEEATQLLRKAVGSGTLPPLKSLIARAMLEEDPDRSVELLDAALELRRFDHEAIALRALKLMQAGRDADASESLEAAVQLFPNDVNLRVYLVLNYAWQERAPEAERVLEKLVADSGDEEMGNVLRAVLEGIEFGHGYYQALWSGSRLKLAANAMRLSLKLRKGLAGGTRESVPSLALHALHVHATRDVDALKRHLLSTKTSREERLLLILEDKPVSVLIASIFCAYLIGELVENQHDLAMAKRFCGYAEDLLAKSKPVELIAINLETCALVYFQRGKFHNDPVSYEKAMGYTRERLASPVPIADMPLWSLLAGATGSKEFEVTLRLAQMHFERKPDDPGRLLLLARVELAAGRIVAGLDHLALLESLPKVGEADLLTARELRQKTRVKIEQVLAKPTE